MSTPQSLDQGPRIYNLFPLLVGKIPNWEVHLDRINEMGFNWIYLNPINYPGFSGSLYSIKDHFTLNSKFAVDERDAKTWNSFKEFVKIAHEKDIKIMMDLVINHTAIDAVAESKDQKIFKKSWYKKKFALIEKRTNHIIRFFEDDEDPVINEYPPEEFKLEKRIANPFAIDPADANKITIWGDLAELSYEGDHVDNLMNYWKKLLHFYTDLGLDGYRCDAAYKIDPEIWTDLIDYTKIMNPSAIFWAETLGCTLKECARISDQFDFIASSSKYWDFTKEWALEQYNSFRKLAPTISFPESHDTKRLARESDGNRELQEFRYLFACFFSAGVQIPIGYEFGFKKKLSVTDTDPSDWEEPRWDLTDKIKQINDLKKKYLSLNQDGPMEQFEYPDLAVLLLKKQDLQEEQSMILIYNKDWHNNHQVVIDDLKEQFEIKKDLYKISLTGTELIYGEKGLEIELLPNGYILFHEK